MPPLEGCRFHPSLRNWDPICLVAKKPILKTEGRTSQVVHGIRILLMDIGLIPGLGRFHMPHSNWVHVSQLFSQPSRVWDFPSSLAGKESICNSEKSSLIPGSGRSPGEGIDYSLQYSWVSLVAPMVKNPPVKVIYCYPAYLSYTRIHHMKCQAGWITSWNQDCQEKYQHLWYVYDTTLMEESEKEPKSLLMKVNEESEKAGLKLNIQKTKIMASSPITSWQIDGEMWKQWQILCS